MTGVFGTGGEFLMDVRIRQAGLSDIGRLVEWRVRVLREVFAVLDSQVLDGLERANRGYYESMLGTGGHIACFAYNLKSE